MRADIRWLDDPEVFRVNKIKAHSDHAFYESREAYEKGSSSLWQSLDGEWLFCYSENAKSRPVCFYEEGFDSSGFDTIKVPGHIELAGYGRPQYINVLYPWDGHVYRRPAYSLEHRVPLTDTFSGAEYAPVGSYIKKFDLTPGLCGRRVCIRFEGVEQAMYLWINGQFLGYSEDSFTPAEFDLTPYLKEKGNVLAVEVHKWSTAAFLEDQDFFRFFGIFRSVSLYAKPALHVEDIWVKPLLAEDCSTGSLSLRICLSGQQDPAEPDIPLSGRGKVAVKLWKPEDKDCLKWEFPLAEEIKAEGLEAGRVLPWDNRHPNLYQLLVTVFDEAGELVELVSVMTGFRRLEIKDKVMLLNGRRLILKGVNRHEWNAESGRCIQKEDMDHDIALFKRNHINAVRTCHYPDQLSWYSLCDKEGIYVMSETNLESHGSWQKQGRIEPSWNVPGSIPEWKGAVSDRAENHFETLKNHPSILFWSLGNESYAGENLAAMHLYFKQKEDGRLVHYEGVSNAREYEDRISDVESRMYATPAEIREYLENAPKKPYILCEYMHDMGNSLGGMKSYMDLLDCYEMYQGGFIWDYIDQAILVKDTVTGRMVLRYGGDFDDRPSDYEFSANGLVFADRTEKPALQEVRYYYGSYK